VKESFGNSENRENTMAPNHLVVTARAMIVPGLILVPIIGCTAMRQPEPKGLIQIGSMHEAVGRQQHHGRVALTDLTAKPHFYAVGALESLRGEITIADSKAVVTGVSRDGHPTPIWDSTAKATMLVG
jgi:hypothetical protein